MKSAGIKKGRLSQDLSARRSAVRSSSGSLLQDCSDRYTAARGESPTPKGETRVQKNGEPLSTPRLLSCSAGTALPFQSGSK